jgi:hypothetical protein
LAAYTEQFTVRKPKPRALAVVKRTCTALVVAGHWERLSVQDTINHAMDAMYSIELNARVSTYSMEMAI